MQGKNHIKQTILIFGGLAGAILVLFELSKLSLVNLESYKDFYVLIAGVLFIAVGFLIHRLLSKKGDVIKSVNTASLKKSGLSKQEYKVLTLMAEGMSNTEIAENLFIAPSTVKTHVSRILGKLNAKRRTEAIKIGRDLDLL